MFEFEFPLFVLVRRFTTDQNGPANVTLHDLITLTAPNAPTALAVFTDRPGAEQFRDEQAPAHQVFEIADAAVLVPVLSVGRQVASVVAFDPFRVGMSTPVAPIEEVIRLYARPQSPDPGTDG